MSGTDTDWQTQIDNQRLFLIIGVSVLGSVLLISIVLIIVLFYWVWLLKKRIDDMDPLLNFRLQRPKLTKETLDTSLTRSGGGINPLARRSQPEIDVMDHSNFSFADQNFSSRQNLMRNLRDETDPPRVPTKTNSFKNPDYLDLDSRFY